MILIIWTALANLIFPHPFHVSVCDIAYKSEDKHLKISVRLFVDDIEAGLQVLSEDPNLDITKPENDARTKPLVEQYLMDNIAIEIKGKSIDLNYLGYELEEDALWAYIEAKKLKKFDEITVTYTPLLEIFEDQENLIHVRRDGVVKSTRVMRDLAGNTLKWED
ncbi:MAG: hypothetical protein JXQ90_13485 [Cyclobacteriaceae bacterium]